MNSQDKRTFRRVALQASGSFDLPDGTTVVGEVVDISMRGVLVRSATVPEIGAEGRLAVVFGSGPEPLVIRGSGTVVRVEDRGFAVEIGEIELEGFHHLQNLVVYNADEPSIAQEEISAHVGLRKR